MVLFPSKENNKSKVILWTWETAEYDVSIKNVKDAPGLIPITFPTCLISEEDTYILDNDSCLLQK